MIFSDSEKRFLEIEGFVMSTFEDTSYLRKLGLLDRNLLDVLNRLAEAVDDDVQSITNIDWSACSHSLSSLIREYRSSKLNGYAPSSLYSYIIETYGAEGIGEHLWIRFVLHSGWATTVQAFTDMPTDVLEEYGPLWWRHGRMGQDKVGARNDLLAAIGERTDIYGSHSMPPELAVGLLFGDERNAFH